MVINAIFDDVKNYNVQDRLDVVIGQSFQLEIVDELPEGFEVFSSNDPVLAIDTNGLHINAMSLGASKIRFMSGNSVVKDLDIYVVNATHPQATTLNGSLGQPIPK